MVEIRTSGIPDSRKKQTLKSLMKKYNIKQGVIISNKDDNPRALPIIKIGNEKFYVDKRLGELRDVEDPSHKESIELYYALSHKK